MKIAMQVMVEVYGHAGRAAEMCRRLAAIFMSYDDDLARVYAHNPEVENVYLTYWRRRPKRSSSEIKAARSDGSVLKVCQICGSPLLPRLKAIIDDFSDPEGPLDITAILEKISMQILHVDTDTSDSQDNNVKRPPEVTRMRIWGGITMQNLEEQGEQQKVMQMALEAQLEEHCVHSSGIDGYHSLSIRCMNNYISRGILYSIYEGEPTILSLHTSLYPEYVSHAGHCEEAVLGKGLRKKNVTVGFTGLLME